MDSHETSAKAMAAEGWYLDPYDRHQQRWFSDGAPTALVRDGTVEAQDDPPGPLPHDPEEVPEQISLTGGSDLRRADSAEAGDQGSPGLERAGDPPHRDPVDAALDAANLNNFD
jgi:hypothetical protein